MLKLCLQIVGVLMFALVLVNVEAARRLKWRDELQKVSLLTRQVFFVHMGFIILLLAMFGALSLFFANALIEQSLAGRVLTDGLALFWTVRLFTQWFVYDRKLWIGHRFNTSVHILFTGVWGFFAGTYGAAFVQQLRAAS